MAKFKFSKKAAQDLKEIYQYGFRKYGERRTDKYIQELEEAFVLLAENPLICRERIEFVPPVRIHPHNKHLIVYVCRADGILIVRLLHGRMDIQGHLLNG